MKLALGKMGMRCFLLPLAAMTFIHAQGAGTIEGITFAGDKNKVFVPLREMAGLMGWQVGFENGTPLLNGNPITIERRLFDGTPLIALSSVKELGTDVAWDPAQRTILVAGKDSSITVLLSDKRVEVDKARQVLEGYQGQRLVFSTNVSTGRIGHGTPNGSFTFGPKARMRYSKLYDNSPMPWSVQVNGNIFVHGYHSVPKRPASHGCIRVPLSKGNPAKWFFHWVESGVPVTISGTWKRSR